MSYRFCFDIESTSTVDLKTAGPAVYWAHPDTILICMKWRRDDGPVHVWTPDSLAIPTPIYEAQRDGTWSGARFVAHNWLFEYFAWVNYLVSKHGFPHAPMKLWDCTMARALYWGLPASLENVCEALNLSVKIDKAKKARIKRMARPRATKPVLTWWHETDPVKLQELLDDCERDVMAECALDDALPPLPDRERAMFLLDGEINERGLFIDADMVGKLTALSAAEAGRLNERMSELTGKRVTTTNQGKKILDELAVLGFPLGSLGKDLIAETLPAIRTQQKFTPAGVGYGLAAHAVAILECRQEAAKASTAKLKAMTAGASPDGRCKGLFQFYGAGRTGRWAARRVQPQNIPRGTVKFAKDDKRRMDALFGLVNSGAPVEDLSLLLPCSVMDAVSGMLRGCITASPGHVLVSGDLAQIEARVVAWLAGQKDVLEVFAKGEDVYTYAASKIGSTNRQLGKVMVLALGFGMGVKKFIDTALTYGIKLTLEEAAKYHAAWRTENDKIVSFWWDVGRAACLIAQSPDGSNARVGKIIFRRTKKAMRIVLPSGRELTYQNVNVRKDEMGRDELWFMGVDPKTKQWCEQRTYGGKLVENIVQATARDVMAEAMLKLQSSVLGVKLIGTVHDELLAEAPDDCGEGALLWMLETMKKTPLWAPGLPVGAEGFIAHRYKK